MKKNPSRQISTNPSVIHTRYLSHTSAVLCFQFSPPPLSRCRVISPFFRVPCNFCSADSIREALVLRLSFSLSVIRASMRARERLSSTIRERASADCGFFTRNVHLSIRMYIPICGLEERMRRVKSTGSPFSSAAAAAASSSLIIQSGEYEKPARDILAGAFSFASSAQLCASSGRGAITQSPANAIRMSTDCMKGENGKEKEWRGKGCERGLTC